VISFGGVDLDPVELGINGNAILGIKESGKSYLGTELGEIFFDNDIPFVAFDPIGIWHNMRYPGRGKGYPIVVAGGFHGDIPLTAATAPAIVEAAMRNRVSLVLDLFHPELSKADWRTIVRDCAFLLLHKNHQHGLRHVFIEEAAEFVPQKVFDGRVYDAVERLIRMGGNSRLGCTLITPRSQEVNKAVLELCENLFLFRQRGKNALENLKKWLEIAGNDAKNIIATLPNLEKGQCWAWLGGRETPILIQVPQKSSFHPDRRQMGADAAESRPKPVSASKFVKTLTAELPKVEEEAKANDPKHLKTEIKRLEGLLAKGGPGKDELARIVALEAEVERMKPFAAAIPALRRKMDAAWAGLNGIEDAVAHFSTVFDGVEAVLEPLALSSIAKKGRGEAPAPAARAALPPPPPMRDIAESGKVTLVPPAGATDLAARATLTNGQAKIVDRIAWAAHSLKMEPVKREILALLIGKHPRTKGFLNDLGALRGNGVIDYADAGGISLTALGSSRVQWAAIHKLTSARDAIMGFLDKRQGEMLAFVLDSAGGWTTRTALAEHFGLHERTKGFLNDLGRLRTLGLLSYGSQGVLSAADYLMER
jgi:hypothetical protein